MSSDISWFAREDWSWRKHLRVFSRAFMESYDCNVRFEISMLGEWDYCFSPTKRTLLLCKHVFPLPFGRNDIGSTLSSSWGSLFLCQRARRVGEHDRSVRNRLWNQLLYRSFKSLTLNQFFAFPLLFLIGSCAVSWCKYYIFFFFSNFCRFSSVSAKGKLMTQACLLKQRCLSLCSETCRCASVYCSHNLGINVKENSVISDMVDS